MSTIYTVDLLLNALAFSLALAFMNVLVRGKTKINYAIAFYFYYIVFWFFVFYRNVFDAGMIVAHLYNLLLFLFLIYGLLYIFARCFKVKIFQKIIEIWDIVLYNKIIKIQTARLRKNYIKEAVRFGHGEHSLEKLLESECLTNEERFNVRVEKCKLEFMHKTNAELKELIREEEEKIIALIKKRAEKEAEKEDKK